MKLLICLFKSSLFETNEDQVIGNSERTKLEAYSIKLKIWIKHEVEEGEKSLQTWLVLPCHALVHKASHHKSYPLCSLFFYICLVLSFLKVPDSFIIIFFLSVELPLVILKAISKRSISNKFSSFPVFWEWL